MIRRPLAITPAGRYRARGIGGQRAIDAWARIDGHLRQVSSLGEGYAQMFAEPVVGDDGTIDWYFSGGDEAAAVALPDLPADEQARIRERLAEAVATLNAHTADLLAANAADARRMGALLQAALWLPADDPSIMVVGNRIVLVNWGMQAQDAGAADNRLLTDYRLPPGPIVIAIRRLTHLLFDRRRGWWTLLWLPFLAVLAVGSYLLLAACGVGAVFGLDYCPVEADGTATGNPVEAEHEALLAALREVEDRLRDAPPCLAADERLPQIAALPEDLAEAPPEPEPEPAPLPQARPEPEPEPEPVPEPEPEVVEPPDEFTTRLEDAGGHTGEVTVTLIWDGDADLDLYVRCPSGEVLGPPNQNACGGRLDIDANGHGEDHVLRMRSEPVENSLWAEGAAPSGRYTVMVNNCNGRSARSRPVPYQIRVQVDGRETFYQGAIPHLGGEGYDNCLGAQNWQQVTQFDVE